MYEVAIEFNLMADERPFTASGDGSRETGAPAVRLPASSDCPQAAIADAEIDYQLALYMIYYRKHGNGWVP
jgi:hypothetical protein